MNPLLACLTTYPISCKLVNGTKILGAQLSALLRHGINVDWSLLQRCDIDFTVFSIII